MSGVVWGPDEHPLSTSSMAGMGWGDAEVILYDYNIFFNGCSDGIFFVKPVKPYGCLSPFFIL